MAFFSFNQLPLYTDDFSFTYLNDINNRDAIVITNPLDSVVESPVLFRSRKTLEEHISYIRKNNIKKAVVVAEDIQFLKECPSLEYVHVLPAITARNFDYAPIYSLPNLKWLKCETVYGAREEYVAFVDYSRFHGLKRLAVSHTKGNQNVQMAGEVVSLIFNCGYPKAQNLQNRIPGSSVRNFSISQSSIKSLDGIEFAPQLRRLELSYNRALIDISALQNLCDSLVYLEIDACGKIQDFSVLEELHNLEYLTLHGSNTLDNLSFLEKMHKLRALSLTMNVTDGDLSLCERIPFVYIKNRKHYSHKNKDLQKNLLHADKICPFDTV